MLVNNGGQKLFKKKFHIKNVKDVRDYFYFSAKCFPLLLITPATPAFLKERAYTNSAQKK